MKKHTVNLLDIAWLLVLCSFLIAPVIGTAHYAMPVLILFATANRRRSVKMQKRYLVNWGFFAAFCFYVLLSSFWVKGSTDNQQSIIVSLLEMVVITGCAWSYFRDTAHLIRFIKMFIWSTVVMAVAFYALSPISTWGTESMGLRLYLWRNAAAYNFGFAAIMALFLRYMGDRQKGLTAAGFFLVIASIFTGSRKVLMIYAVALASFVVLAPGGSNKLKVFVGAAVASVFALWVGMSIPAVRELYANRLLQMFKGLESTDSSTVVRTYMQQYAILLFMESPIIGHGVDGFALWFGTQSAFLNRWAMTASYSHCNFTELLANYGIIGFFLFYFPPVKEMLIGLRAKENKLVRLGLVLIITFIAAEYGTVSYYTKYCIYILMIGVACVQLGRTRGMH